MSQVGEAALEAVRGFAAKPYFREVFGFELAALTPGEVHVALDQRPELGHQPGFFQGAFVSAAAEYAATWSAVTLAPAGSRTATLDQTIKFVAPARGERLIARGRVIRAGRSISTAAADVVVIEGGVERLCAVVLQSCRHEPSA